MARLLKCQLLFKFVFVCLFVFVGQLNATQRINSQITYREFASHHLRHKNWGFDANFASTRRYVRQTPTMSPNMTWPVKRVANIEGDIILGEYLKALTNRAEFAKFARLLKQILYVYENVKFQFFG